MKKVYYLLMVVSVIAFSTDMSHARPERIKAGISYYSEDYTTKDGISDIGDEKNYEEVFKNYEYYEAVYDEHKRITRFRAYKRGDIVLIENYSYNDDGKISLKQVTDAGGKTTTIKYGK